MQEPQAKFWATTKPQLMKMPLRLDSTTASDMELSARNFIQSGAQNLVLDCAELDYLTSSGMHALLTIAKLMQNVHGKLTVRRLHGQPKDMFLACGFDQTVAIDDAALEAAAAVAA